MSNFQSVYVRGDQYFYKKEEALVQKLKRRWFRKSKGRLFKKMKRYRSVNFKSWIFRRKLGDVNNKIKGEL